jgi:hypothetical protein
VLLSCLKLTGIGSGKVRSWIMPEFTEADLLRLAGQIERAEAEGWVLVRHSPCGVVEHRHRWRITAWLCSIMNGIYGDIGGWNG